MKQTAKWRKMPDKETLRRYTEKQVQRFLEEDKLNPRTAAWVRELLRKGKL